MKEMGTTSNYEKQALMARELFLNYDWQEMTARYQLSCDDEYLYLPLLGQEYRISGKTGEVGQRAADGSYTLCLDYNVVMILYDILCYPKGKPELSGTWCPLQSLQATMSSPSPDLMTARCARMFAGRADRLLKSCKKLGGVQPELRAGSDVCWQFPVFPFFPVQLRFWDQDEEFEAKIQLLWDRNSLAFLHFETLYYVAGHLMEELLKGLAD